MDIDSASSLVLQTLTQATSQDTAVLKPAEEQLKQWETQPGFYSVLLNIFNNHMLDVNVRWLAVLYFKNGIDRYWRRVAPHSLSEEEKTSLRAGLITNFNEPINQIATQIAVLIAKVARLDCPRQWPQLIPVLMESVRGQDGLQQHRALLTFHHVTKTLASKRLAQDRRLFQDEYEYAQWQEEGREMWQFADFLLRELASGIYSFACSLWSHHTDCFLQQIYASDEAAALSSLERTLLSLKGNLSPPPGTSVVLRKLTVHGFQTPQQNMEVMLLDFLEYHPCAFISLIQQSLEFAVSYLFTPAGEGVSFERFTVQCMNLIKMIVKNDTYKPNKNIEDSKPESLEAHNIKTAFFTHETLTEIGRRLVSHYFLLNEEELAMWEEDPEGFAVEETGGDSWKYSLRPCTEVLFLDIFHKYSQTLIPVLLEMVQNLQGPTNVEDPVQLLMKDAVYNAVGLAAYELFDNVDFDQWFKNQLLGELQVSHHRYKLIRRRVIWLIGQWISVKFKSDLRPLLYEVILSLMQDPDLVLLQQVTECDTKMQVLHVISCVIERVHIQGLGAESKNLYPFLLPVIQLSTDVSKPPHVYLLEDGLELWLVTLENSPGITPELLRIFPNMSALF
ncbi:hypothetical protein NHX12_029034, partial [Muraenolepis orangiensis]